MNELHPDDEEWIDLVDDSDQVIERRLRSDIYQIGKPNFRVVNGFLVNSQGELWIPRRSSNKALFPLCLDVSVGGHVSSGETYDQAFERELAEELRLKLSEQVFRLIGYLTPIQHGVSAFMCVYEIQTNATPDYNREDFISAAWLKPHELITILQSETRIKGDLPKLAQQFYAPKGVW